MARSPYANRKGLHFGEKVAAWLKTNGGHPLPGSHKALAELIRETQPRVSRAIKSGTPQLHVARKIAAVMGMSLDYLSDPDALYPPVGDAAWEAFEGGLSPEQRARFAERLRSPAVRDLLLESRGGAEAHPSPRPRGSRP